jgi:hypothetical protein
VSSTHVAVRPERRHVRHHAGLVVRGASPVEAAVALDRHERVALPQREVTHRLHVVVRVEEHGRCAGRCGPAPDHGGQATARTHDPRVEPTAAQQLRHRFGGTLHVGVVEAVERDAGDADKAFEIGTDSRKLARDRRAQLRLAQGHAGNPTSGRVVAAS